MIKATVVLMSCVASLAACAPQPAPAKPPPAAAPEPPPPPPPKCDALDQGCVAAADTRSSIQTSSWTIAPPPKWTYAHETEATVAKIETASLGVLVHETGDRKTEAAKRSAAFDTITKKLGLTLPKKKKFAWPPKPAQVLAVENVKLALYQFEGVTQNGKAGVLLVFTTRLPDKQSLLGAGFVLESDNLDADKAIMASLQSLRAEAPAPATPPGVSDAGADAR